MTCVNSLFNLFYFKTTDSDPVGFRNYIIRYSPS